MSLKPIINSGQNDGNNTQSFTTESIANRMLYDTLQTRALVNKGKKLLKILMELFQTEFIKYLN